jgi:hypothetical protein
MADALFPENKLVTDEEMKNYFNSLPANVQETIRLSGDNIKTLDELKSCAENLIKMQ